MTLAPAASRTGDQARAQTIIKDLAARQPPPAAALARWYAAAGDTERALTLLEQLAQDRPMAIQQLRFDPAFDRLRALPRFKRLRTGAGSVAG